MKPTYVCTDCFQEVTAIEYEKQSDIFCSECGGKLEENTQPASQQISDAKGTTNKKSKYMPDTTQYVIAAIHGRVIPPEVVIDRYEDKHRAKTIELNLDDQRIYKEAKKAKSRNTKFNFLMLFPGLYISISALELLNSYYYDIEDMFARVVPALLFVTIAIFIKQRYVDSYIKNIKKQNATDKSNTKEQNVIISGGYSPFVGYGIDMDSWSFTVNLKKIDNPEKTLEKVDIKELLNTISGKIKQNIHNSNISDKLFVNGKDIRNTKLFMKTIMDKPIVEINHKDVEHLIGKSNEYIRHYRVVTIPMWSGQVNLSIFLRFTILGDQLYAESRFFLLPPLKENFMILDNAFSKSGFSYFYSQFIVSAFKSLYTWTLGPIMLFSWLGKIQEAIVGDPENKLKRQNDTYNYGHTNSLRELWLTPDYQRYFQMVDNDLNYKVSQHIIVNSIVDYLESKGISTADIKERQTTILNSGVIVTGGTVNAGQMAVGKGAAFKNKVANAMPKKNRGEG